MAFKTVEWVRQVRDGNYEQTRDMSFDERLAFYERKSASLRRKLERIRNRPRAGQSREQ